MSVPLHLFPGWRMSPGGERRLFERAEDVPEGWFREGDASDPRRHGGGGSSPAAEAPVEPPAVADGPSPAAAVPAVLTHAVEVPAPEPPTVGDPDPGRKRGRR